MGQKTEPKLHKPRASARSIKGRGLLRIIGYEENPAFHLKVRIQTKHLQGQPSKGTTPCVP
ncbi:uncharacterized protein ANIA_11363 [Aspergillus nidulans FGSC A4]|uniref:Uncharacterized protein n=1 Tax=Emericella nidulans (strain FGSC A4 / ATCC 38163 / CBS 112.46 / NRRL 194 / M139) TaxID=227321 RepID=C8VJN1_EMENI|nr:hypothetical protein [Aspergillus nidulans FGSC A4]CBF84048.1 TPA: hypothetical protein ANIA_11363 [Aspergillus nidulans FGSC A4]